MDLAVHRAPAQVSPRIDQWLAAVDPPTPCVVVDLDAVRLEYQRIADAFPFATIFYAVKANPALEIIQVLAGLGASFDLASWGEIERCLATHVPPQRLSFGNTIKRAGDIERAVGHGIALYALDSEGELEKVAQAAPGAAVFCRLAVPPAAAEWPLTGKFGCHPEMAIHLLLEARRRGVKAAGLSFHVGSQQTDPQAWDAPIAMAAEIFRACAAQGVDLDYLNLGGGLPAQYRSAIPRLGEYAERIDRALSHGFGSARPRIVIEPGRGMVGDAGLLRAHVLLVARKSRGAARRWVFLDAGRYNGLPETMGERIHYRLRGPREGTPAGPVILAGPTCDSTDILYAHAGYELPLDLAAGDTVDFLSAGAYTASYASVEFNGFAPIRSYAI